MLILSQEPWSTGDVPGVERIVAAASAEAARRAFDTPDWTMLLMPLGDDIADEAAFTAAVGAIAARYGLYLAGAARLSPAGDAPAATIGFLFQPDGTLALRTGKISPDLIQGFSDDIALPAAEAQFPVVKLPFAQVGMLAGEDILFTQYGRSIAFHGAEMILNPCAERSDRLTESRQMSRYGRAAESCAYVAIASPRSAIVGGLTVQLPTVTGFYNWERPLAMAQGQESFIFPDVDMQSLRRKRMMNVVSFPAMVRANTFGEGYRMWAEEAGTLPAPASRDAWIAEARRRMARETEMFGPKLTAYEEQYDVISVQATAKHIPLNSNDTRQIMLENLEDTLAFVSPRASSPSVRILVFPEFWIAGSGGIGGIQRNVSHLEPLAINIDGDPVLDRLGKFAQDHKTYIAFQNFEIHDKLPHRAFNSAFLLNDSGDLINVYRKNQCADIWGMLPDTVPGSIFDKYVDAFGYEGLFPVVDTPLGKLANTVCFDVAFPEVAFGLRHYGAEVILHSTAEGHGTEGRLPWDNGRRLRAWENGAYYVSANTGGRYGDKPHLNSIYQSRGYTKIINYDGTQQGIADGPGQAMLMGHIDLAALRRFRADPRFNLHVWSDAAAYAGPFCGDVGLPNNLWDGDPFENPYYGSKLLNGVIKGYVDKGIYVQPTSKSGKEWQQSVASEI